MNTTHKGNKLEDKFHKYLQEQHDRGELVYDAHLPELCKIYKKKKYDCPATESKVEFDIVIELFRKNQEKPYLYLVFECKNHKGNISTIYVNEFVSKLNNVFPGKHRGVLVTSSNLQSGANSLARNKNLGIVKYDEYGIEFIAERKASSFTGNRHIQSQLIGGQSNVKPLKFSATYKNRFFSSPSSFMGSILPKGNSPASAKEENRDSEVPYISKAEIQQIARDQLDKINYKKEHVDLHKVCASLSIDLHFTGEVVRDQNGELILGSADFENRSIQINLDQHAFRTRFTTAHEIGHFCLGHDQFLRTDSILENDLFANRSNAASTNYERLEIQANSFASDLLLPEFVFKRATYAAKKIHDVRGNSSADIYVDNQPANFTPYNLLMEDLSRYFGVSKMAIEIKFKQLKMIDDRRSFQDKTEPFDTIVGSFSKIWGD